MTAFQILLLISLALRAHTLELDVTASGFTSDYDRGPGSPPLDFENIPVFFGRREPCSRRHDRPDDCGPSAAPTHAPTHERIPLDQPVEQRKLTHVGEGFVTLSWITQEHNYSQVVWGTSRGSLTERTNQDSPATSYTCNELRCGAPLRGQYWSGLLHGATLGPLSPLETYYYAVVEDGAPSPGNNGSCAVADSEKVDCGFQGITEDQCLAKGCCFDPEDEPVSTSYMSPCFFTTSGPVYSFQAPAGPGFVQNFSFALAGDVGITHNSITTVDHILLSAPNMVVHPGDLSYANCLQPIWDAYGKLVEPLSATVPWMTVTGNHEPERPIICGRTMNKSFAAYDARYGQYLPYAASGSPDPHFYSWEAGGAHWVMLGSYTDYKPGSPQLEWLAADLASVDRSRTPWLIAAVHSPWYNSNNAHYNETEEYFFRMFAEPLLHAAHVDAMFAGHVHAYERSLPVYNNEVDSCGATFITIGDAGNHEGLATGWKDPQPEWSAYRESSYGHGVLTLINETHMQWKWHRNQDDEPVVSDTAYIPNFDTRCPGAAKDTKKGV